MNFSIVIPVYNEEHDIVSRYNQLRRTLADNLNNYELIYIDNNSADSGLEVLRKMKQEDEDLKVIALDKNYGKFPAFLIGFTHAKGDMVLTINTDFKFIPDDFLRVISELKDNDAVICRDSSRYFMQGSLRFFFIDNYRAWYLAGYRKKCLDALKLSRGIYSFVPKLLGIYDCKLKEIYRNERLLVNNKAQFCSFRLPLKYIYGFLAIKWMQANKLKYKIVQ